MVAAVVCFVLESSMHLQSAALLFVQWQQHLLVESRWNCWLPYVFAHSQAKLASLNRFEKKPAQSAVYRDPFTTHHSRSQLAEIAARRTGEPVEPPTVTTCTSLSAEAVDPCTRRPLDWLNRQFCFAGRLYCEAETSHWRYPSPTYRYARRLSLLFPRPRSRWSMPRVFT
ncbi:hypothetical protein GGI35DRAFT_43707 [Trichoderma velutinum]